MKKPTYLETLKARTQPRWRCRLHNKVKSVNFDDSQCNACKKAEARRQEVVAWMKQQPEPE